jgi:hypothetical protein
VSKLLCLRRSERYGVCEDAGRGGANLYRLIFYRTAGGCCVQNREMEDGGIEQLNREIIYFEPHYELPKQKQ